MADPPAPPPSNKSYLTAPAYPSTEVFYHAYLPSDHRDLVVFKNGEPCCNTDDIRFNYYGGWASLFAQVDKFRNFPGSLNQYKAELSTIYPWVMPKIYNSLKGGYSYIYKHDILLLMQYNLMDGKLQANEKNFPIMAITAIYMRTKEEALNDKCELVRYDKEKFEELKNRVESKTSNMTQHNRKHRLNKKTLDEVFEKVKQLLPVNSHDPEFTELRKHLQKFHQQTPVSQNAKYFENIINVMDIILTDFDAFIAANPSLFRNGNDDKDTLVVRLFDEVKCKHVFAYELMEELERCGCNTVKLEEAIQAKDPTFSLLFQDVFKLLDGNPNIHFIAIPLPRTRKRAVWIPAVDGHYCISARDLVFEFVAWAVVKGLFQGASDEQRDNLMGILKGLRYLLDGYNNGYRMVLETDVNRIRKQIVDKCKAHGIAQPEHFKDIRRVIYCDTTEDGLKAELKYLGMDKVFPEILELADDIFKKPELKALRETDAYQTVENCQIQCIINRAGFAEFFVHSTTWYVR
ncbi:unnamed protein product [Caenorhabditis nigoni]